MKNKKVIVLAGFARGGTSIVWNILQSHPEICAPDLESGELIAASPVLSAIFSRPRLLRLWPVRRAADRLLFRLKMENLDHRDNRYVAPSVLYTRRQVARAALCLKSVNRDVRLTEHLVRIYPGLYFICLTRNGYALCEGYRRRNHPVEYAAELYSRMARKMQELSLCLKRFKLVRFEDVLADPFAAAGDLYRFVEVDPRLDWLRLKSKKVMGRNGVHATRYGEEHRKYWFTRETISEILEQDIDRRQASRLDEEDVRAFRRRARGALSYFGYSPDAPASSHQPCSTATAARTSKRSSAR